MIPRDIKCGACGFEGKIEAYDTVPKGSETQLFKNLSKDSEGFLYFRCPSCNEHLVVDPLTAIDSSQLYGLPKNSFMDKGRSSRSNRHVPIIWGIIYLIAALFIFTKLDVWWTDIIGIILLMLAWVSIKTGLFASEKEIKEFTEPGPLSEETKKKISGQTFLIVYNFYLRNLARRFLIIFSLFWVGFIVVR